ncbi:MAG: NYN domain-containing protein [Planctomycetales bacterium]|jgi:predicted RNA-binding protein with PIN domain
MAQRFRIIDGYNLMHSVGYARERYGQGGLERSRNRLLRFLINRLDHEERRRTTIVFDARTIPFEGVREQKLEGMTILFNKAGSDADTLIEELILEHSAPKQLEVVSGDRRLQKAIKRRKGIAVESEDFARLLRDRESIVPGSSQDVDSPPDTDGKPESAAPSQSDTEYWMEVFGEVEISGATPETIQPKKPLDLNQSSDWDTHVKKLMDDLDVDGLSE